MARTVKLLVLAFLFAALGAPGAGAGDLHFLYGNRTVNDDFDPVDDQKPYGVQWFIGKPGHLNLLLGAFRSDEEDSFTDPILGPSREKTAFTELSAGFAKVWGVSVLRSYLGVGATRLKVEDKLTVAGSGLSFADDASVTTVYGNGGLILRLGKAFEIGAEVRYVPRASLDLFGSDVDADYKQYSAFAGFGW